jgi:hypothetical protein
LTLFTLNVFAAGHVVTINSLNPCSSLCNGSATAVVSGGIGPFNYTWNGSAGVLTGQSVSGLCYGSYILIVTDSSDMSTASDTLILNYSFVQINYFNLTSTPCTLCNGAAGIGVSGGSAPYTYDWFPGTPSGDGTDSIYNLCIGTYTVSVTDANGCTSISSTTQVTIDNNLSLTIDSVTASSCSGCTGTASVSVAGGVAPYNYLWSDGSTGSTVNSLCSGVHDVIVTDANGCSNTVSTYISQNSIYVASFNVIPTPCTACDGSAKINIYGGTPPYIIDWMPGTPPGDGTDSVYNLCIGAYSVSVTDANGCTSASSTTSVVVSSTITASVDSTTLSGCSVCDGTANVVASGGVPPYTYLWSDGNTSQTATGLCAGSYTVTATDQNGCSYTTTTYIENPYIYIIDLNQTPTVCGACDGSAGVTVAGGIGSYNYDWSPGTPAGDGTYTIYNLCAGTYTVVISDATGCTSGSSTAYVTISNIGSTLNSSNTSTPSSCGACNGTVSIIGSGGVPPYLFDLSNGAPQQTNGNFSGVCAGDYTTTITDSSGCSVFYYINVSTQNTTNFTVSDSVGNETGVGLADGFIDLTITGTSPPYTFLWSNGATSEDIYSLSEGTYSVLITDNNGDCGTYDYYISEYLPYGWITGYIYSDTDTNCIFDSTDFPLSGYYVIASNGLEIFNGITDSSGYYSIAVPPGTYIVEAADSVALQMSCTTVYNLNILDGDTLSNNNFSYNISPFYDVCVSAWSNGIVPGFNGYYYAYISNVGNQSASGAFYLVLPGLLDYVSSFPAASSISGDTVFWNYSNISGGTSYTFILEFYTPSSAVLGTSTTAYINATVTNGTDINPACNSYAYSRLVTGSFDPNEKTVSPSGEGANGEIALTEDEFSYLIRFQNTGSGPAVNISIIDTLSSLLDPSSFLMLNASHDYSVDMLSGNVVAWTFYNIILPDSTSNEPESHGHVQFKINKLNAPAEGEVIENKAYIYFDFNEPIITNTAINTYVATISVNDQNSITGSVKVYPNPFSENTTFVIHSEKQNEVYSFELTDVLGKKVRTMTNISDKQFSISRNSLENGIYFYRIYSAENTLGIGKLIVK